MKKTLVITICLLFSFLGAAAQTSHKVKSYTGDRINGVIVAGAFDVQLSQGEETGVSIEIREDATSKLSVTMTEQGYIRIAFGDDLSKYFIDKKRPLAKIVLSQLDYINLSGNVSLIAKGEFSCPDKFSMLMTGKAFASFIKLKCKDANIDLQSKSKIEDITINATNKVEYLAGESSISDVTINCKDISVKSELASLVDINGKATEKSKIVSAGTSKLTMVNFTSPLMDVTATEMSRVNINVTEAANITKTSLAAIRFIGNGKIVGDGAKPL